MAASLLRDILIHGGGRPPERLGTRHSGREAWPDFARLGGGHVLALKLLEPDCLALEVRGFEAQAVVTRLFWPDDLPSGTALERNIAAAVRDSEQDGRQALRRGWPARPPTASRAPAGEPEIALLCP
jgi:hypothetical protein